MRTRRRSRTLAGAESAGIQDIGKDLFAYLFLVVMVFSFMIIITMGNAAPPGKNSPQKHELTNRETLKKMKASAVGALEKKGDDLFLKYGDALYHPVTDFPRLKTDGRIIETKTDDGADKLMIYLMENKDAGVLLSEYLTTFQSLGDKGVGVAFVEHTK